MRAIPGWAKGFQGSRPRARSRDVGGNRGLRPQGPSLWDSGACWVWMGWAGAQVEVTDSWWPSRARPSQPLEGQLTCLRKVIGCWPMAWASPMLARMTSVNGFLIP